MFMGQGLKLIIQAAYFVIIARSLGANQYGAFIAVTAFTQMVAPFVGLGSGNLLVKNVARDRSLFSLYWGKSLFMTAFTGLGLLGALLLAARLVMPSTITGSVIAAVAVADLVFMKLVDCASWAFQAHEKLQVTAALQLILVAGRLIGIGSLVVMVAHPTAQEWSYAYLATTVLGAVVGLCWVHLKLGRPKLELRRIKDELAEGFYFSTGLSAQTIYNDIDKAMLARLSTLDATGIYGAAYRFIDIAFIPVRSLLLAASPSFFRVGRDGIESSFGHARKLMVRPVLYSIVAFAGLMVLSPVIPAIIGPQYARTVEALRWLALLPLFKTLHYFIAESLTGAGYQGLRCLVQVFVAVVNVLLNIWLVPKYSWRGAAWVSVISDGLLVVGMLGFLFFVQCRERYPCGRVSDAITQG
jgi:O-antigen/teichoic acid export membrane protein